MTSTVPPTVLLIDDSEDIQDLVEARLAPLGVRVLRALLGKDGIDQALDHRPDVILLDLDLPDRNGFDVFHDLRADPCTSSTPVIFLTGDSGFPSRTRGIQLGADAYITKPFDGPTLRGRLESTLREKERRDEVLDRFGVDALTRRPGRVQMEAALQQHIEDPDRGGRRPCLCVFDVRGMRRFSATHGHAAGDEVLVTISRHLAHDTAYDGTYRLHGDRLAVTCFDGAPRRAALADLHRVVDAMVRDLGSEEAPLGVAAGAALWRAGMSAEALLEEAGAALAGAKAEGGSRFAARGWDEAAG